MSRIGVVLSAGGSAFARSFDLSGLPADRFLILTDRPCGAEEMARERDIQTIRIEEPDRAGLSQSCADRMSEADCHVALLHFSRLVDENLFERIPTLNVHPGLLPAFPGLDGVGDAFAANSLFQGATLHWVDGGVDTGPAISQCVSAVPKTATLEWRQKLAYLHKVIVTLQFMDWFADAAPQGLPSGGGDWIAEGAVWINPGMVSPHRQQQVNALMQELPRRGRA